MTPETFRAIHQTLLDENPFAARTVLKILDIEFTDTVPTLAVTCADRPTLLVNLDFLATHCATEAHVKAVLCHEFLHVLLRHTEQTTPITPADHLATDAVINAIIHRTLGADYSDMMARYYRGQAGPAVLLRPRLQPSDWVAEALDHAAARKDQSARVLLDTWQGLYSGRLVVDDIRDIATELLPEVQTAPLPPLLGGHAEAGTISGPLAEALQTSLRAMNGSGIFRNPSTRGSGGTLGDHQWRAASEALGRWQRETLEVLRRHVAPDPSAPGWANAQQVCRLPVLSAGDRRATLRAGWSPFLPEASWMIERPVRRGAAQVYLDVSGSMDAEMPQIVQLLGQLGDYIRRPFWAFSDVVVPARIVGGRLETGTTGGTSLACVLEHIARTVPPAAVIVTDGYVEALAPDVIAAVRGTRLHVVLTRDGQSTLISRAGLPYTQLSKVPR